MKGSRGAAAYAVRGLESLLLGIGVFGALLAMTGRVATARTTGANIGAGLLLFASAIVIPIMIVAILIMARHDYGEVDQCAQTREHG